MAHYFTNDKVKSNEKTIKTKINNKYYYFYVDNGVFSKRGLDFGTRTLLENIEKDKIHGQVLDVGCGWGPIGIYIASETNAEVDMIDINERSLSLTKKNLKLNQTKANVFQSDIYSNINKKYDFIITNPPIKAGKKTLYEIIFKAFDYLKKDGQLWLVINKNSGAKSLLKDLTEKYQTEIVKKHKGFFIIKTKKY